MCTYVIRIFKVISIPSMSTIFDRIGRFVRLCGRIFRIILPDCQIYQCILPGCQIYLQAAEDTSYEQRVTDCEVNNVSKQVGLNKLTTDG